MEIDQKSWSGAPHPLCEGFPNGSGTEAAAVALADGFSLMEAENQRVDRVGVHPSIANQFALALHDQMDLDVEGAAMGMVFGARVTLDGDAPEGGFTLESEGGRSLRFAPPPRAKEPPGGVPVLFGANPVRPLDVARLLDLGRVWGRGSGSIWMELTARTYAGFRKFGQEILEIETSAAALKTGLMGTAWGVPVRVSRDAHPTRVMLRDDHRVIAILETDKAANPAVKALSEQILRDGCPEDLAERVAGKMREAAREALTQISYDLSDATLPATRPIILKAALAELTRSFAQGRW